MASPGSKKNMDSVLSIDCGTQSIRASFIDPRGKFLGISKIDIEPYFSLNPGWAEQHPEYFWKNLCLATKKLFSTTKINSGSLRGVVLTAQRSSVINLDRSGKPLRPAIVWLDQRKAGIESWPPLYLKTGLKLLNLLDPVKYAVVECEANWIRQNQPEIWEKTYRYLYLSGYLNYRLTGEFRDSSSNIVGYVPFDYRKHQWAAKNDIKWKMFPMRGEILPELVKPGDVIGMITEKSSLETGIPAGLPVFAAAADKACETLGSGCLSPDTACISYGTTATVNTTNSRYVELVRFFPSYPSAVPGAYNTEVMIYRGYWMVNWFKREFGQREVEIAKKRKIRPEILFDELIKKIPAGSMGLTLQPYWSPGVKIPGPEAKGAIIGFGDIHTRAHIYRALIEGIAYALKEGFEHTQKKNGTKIEKIVVSGGGSQSREAMQITADIFGMAVEKPRTYETSSLGAAIDAYVGLKIHNDFRTAVNEMTGISEVFEPDMENMKLYHDLYENVYLKMYDRLKGLYSSIRNITGYPGKH